MSWNLKVIEPSGETRIFPIKGNLLLGRSKEAQIILRDPTVAPEAALVWATDYSSPSPFWIKILESSVDGRIGDLKVKEAQIPCGIPFKLGETRFLIESTQTPVTLPVFPSGVRAWLSCSDSGKELIWNAKKSASTSLSIYIAGETGTGKEVLAHLIHAWSDRRSGPFVPLHCGALPLSLAESELFGHVKGAFTGAFHHRPGALMQAHGGTLFLDEVADLPLDIQVKLLRFLENGEIRAVGADRSSKANVRLICATHRPLLNLVEQGKFRQDLYYRLASITVEIPPLRTRPEDIELLAKQFAKEHHRALSPQALLRLKAHPWPGNVRELRHAIERGIGLAGDLSAVLGEEAFSFLLAPHHLRNHPELALGSSVLSLREIERAMLLKALKLTSGNRGKAAKILGVARSTLFEMLKRHQIVGPKSPSFPLNSE